MSAEPRPGAWLDPVFDTWGRIDRLARAVSGAVTVAGVAICLLYVGAVLERRALKARLTVVDGVDAVREATARREAEVDGGGRG